MVTKYSRSLNWKLSFVRRQILISFWRKSHSGQPVVHPWESPEWSPWFAGIPLNWSSIGRLSIAARAVEKLARAVQQNLSEKLNSTESRDRLHTLRRCLHNQSFYHRRKIWRPDMSPHLLLGGCTDQSSGHWWVGGGDGYHPRWVAVYWQAHPPSDGHRPTARPVGQRTRTWAEALLLKYASYWPRENICLESWKGRNIKAISFLVLNSFENFHLVHICLNMICSNIESTLCIVIRGTHLPNRKIYLLHKWTNTFPLQIGPHWCDRWLIPCLLLSFRTSATLPYQLIGVFKELEAKKIQS